jgi:hypothetical protein
MNALLLRHKTLARHGGLLLAVALGLAGCALQNVQGDAAATMRVAAADPPPASDQAAPPEPRPKTAVKAAHAKVAAARPARQPAAGQDETSCASVEVCASVLKAMVANPDRSWLKRPAAPAVLANGVRLFAYRALKPALACEELAAAKSEVEAAARTFSGPVAGLQAAQIRRVRSLSVDVGAELGAESAQRCASRGKGGPVG